MSDIFYTTLDEALYPKLREGLIEQGFLSQHPSTHSSRKKPGVTCTLYSSFKLTVQGKNKQEFLEFYLEPEILKTPLYTYKNELLLKAPTK